MAIELGLTLSLFVPFIEWPRLLRRVRLGHLIIGVIFSYAIYQPTGDITVNESIVAGVLWLTYTFMVIFVGPDVPLNAA